MKTKAGKLCSHGKQIEADTWPSIHTGRPALWQTDVKQIVSFNPHDCENNIKFHLMIGSQTQEDEATHPGDATWGLKQLQAPCSCFLSDLRTIPISADWGWGWAFSGGNVLA